MPITLAGTLPLSSINIGLGASVAGITARVSKLQADISDVTPAIQASLDVAADFPPNPASLSVVLGAALAAPELAAVLTPANMASITADANAGIVAKLGVVDGQIAAVGGIKAGLAGGLEAGSITGWSYAGGCNGFGPVLARETRLGFSEFAPADVVSGVLIVTQSLTGWQHFAKGVSADPAAVTVTATDQRLISHGRRTGAGWNAGVASVSAQIDLFLAELRGMKANLEASLRISGGFNLPDPKVVVDAGLDAFGRIGVDGIASNLVNVRTDVNGTIGAIQVKVDADLSLAAELNGQLSAGGFSVWLYSGRADGFGEAITGALQNGVPGGSGGGALVYGLALAGAGPSMSAFGGIFKT